MGYLQDLKIADIPGAPVNGQFFPYEIYGDAYGARIVPENVGFIQPVLTNMGDKVANVDDLISILKRNRKLRDVWGSLFLHPYLLDTVENGGIAESAGDTAKLEKLLRTIKDLDYEVVDMKVWAKENRDRRPKTFEVE